MADAREQLIELMTAAVRDGLVYPSYGKMLDALLSDEGRPLMQRLIWDEGRHEPLLAFRDHAEMVEYLKDRGVLVPMVVHPESFAASIGFEDGFRVVLPGPAMEDEQPTAGRHPLVGWGCTCRDSYELGDDPLCALLDAPLPNLESNP